VELALHPLRQANGRALLLLHGLGERAPAALPDGLLAWPGPVLALDFTGHGASSVPVGGGYTSELLMADADAALAELGSATLLGRGLGAWVALLLSGARPREVRGAILCDGPGLAGGGARPGTPAVLHPGPDPEAPPDPFALVELSHDLRPPDYARGFARNAAQLSGLDRPISVVAVERPEWLASLLDAAGVEQSSLAEALATYAAVD
jgi:pimeloyl-ACP methyl ester carboxylesterase